MPRRLVVLNAALVAVALVSVGYVIRELRAPAQVAERRPPRPAPPAVAPAAPPADTPAGGYGMLASRNLFSPTRSEAPVSATAAAPSMPKPNLYGIILRDGAPVAYLEDPSTKRVAGYRLGDSVAGGTVKTIGADHVVLNRPEGDVSVRLRDPSKPRPVAPPATQPVAPATPGVPPGATPPAITPQQPGQPSVLPRRPLPPNLLRRLPPSASDAPAQR